MKDIYDILREWKKRRGEKCQSGSALALATLVCIKGSSYRRPGARMLICTDGNSVGSLSAGCLEEEVASRARQVLLSGEPALVSFDTRKRFGCAGRSTSSLNASLKLSLSILQRTWMPGVVALRLQDSLATKGAAGFRDSIMGHCLRSPRQPAAWPASRSMN